jgi:hypothetical protein
MNVLVVDVDEGGLRRQCADCRRTFTMSASECDWFAQRGWTPPRRCADCRKARRDARRDDDYVPRR